MDYNIYCDESCHLEHDGKPLMALGAVWCSAEKTKDIFVRLREIKRKNGLSPNFEMKWTKISPGKVQLYLDIIDYFFDDDSLHFRGLIAIEKSRLDHLGFRQNHDTWYYKMYFNLLKAILNHSDTFRVYLDIKDTNSTEKVQKLHEVLANDMYDFQKRIVRSIQMVRSHEVELIQLADLLTGALSYVNRGISSSEAKVAVVERIRERSGLELTKSTFLGEEKMNLFKWRPRHTE